MLETAKAFSTFSVDDTAAAKKFYADTLGLKVEDGPMGLTLKTAGNEVFIYQKDDHTPASFTVLNFPVADLDATVQQLKDKGVEFEHYDSGMVRTDEKGIARGKASGDGPDIAWFKDTAGNVLSVLSE